MGKETLEAGYTRCIMFHAINARATRTGWADKGCYALEADAQTRAATCLRRMRRPMGGSEGSSDLPSECLAGQTCSWEGRSTVKRRAWRMAPAATSS